MTSNLPAIAEFTVRAKRDPLASEVYEATATYGLSIRELIGCDGDDFAVAIGDETIPSCQWAWRKPLPGQDVLIVAIPRNDGVKSLLLTAAAISAAIFAAPLLPAFAGMSATAATSFWSAAIMAGSGLLMQALVKPPTTDPQSAPRSLSNISAIRNRFAPYEPVPVTYGRRKVYPPYAAQPYTEIVGDDQYFNALFALGIGEHEISDAKIGDTLLTNYQGVQLVKTLTPSWPNISELDLSTQLEDPSRTGSPTSSATFTTAEGSEMASVDFMAPAGLLYVNTKSEEREVRIDFRVEYRPAGSSGAWTNVINLVKTHPVYGNQTWIEWTYGSNYVNTTPGLAHNSYVGPLRVSPRASTDFRVVGKTRDGIRFGLKWEFPAEGQYDVRITRTYMEQAAPFNGTDDELRKYAQTFIWTKLRSHDTNTAAVNTEGQVEYLQLRIKADDQIQGVIDQLSVIATRKLPKWTGTSWTAPVATRNPAWAYLDILMGYGNARPIDVPSAAQRIWLSDFVAWANSCEEKEFWYDDVIEQKTSVFFALAQAAAAGRAARSRKDTRHTIVREEDSQTPTQLFTNRNSRNYRFTRKFYDNPHGFHVRFPSELADYQEDEIIVYDDGYNENNATKFETLVLKGITNPDQAWKFGRFHIAQARLRQKLHNLEVDFEHLASLRGDLVHVQNDVMLAASGSGRIVSRVGNMIETDEAFIVEGGKSYAAKFRVLNTATGSIDIIDRPVQANVGTGIRQFIVNDLDPRVKPGDLMIFGEAATITVPLKITRIDPRAGLNAELTLVDHAPGILTADTQPIPPYSPVITLPPDPERVIPPTPRIIKVESGTNLAVVLPSGQRAARLIVSYDSSSYAGLPLSFVEARVRTKQESGSVRPWMTLPRQGVTSASVAKFDVSPGEVYQIQIRVISAFGTPSAWSGTAEHEVEGVSATTPAPDYIEVEATGEGLAITLGVSTLDQRDINRVQVRINTTDDRDSAVAYFYPVPTNFEDMQEVDVFIPLSGEAATYYVWARFENIYADPGAWIPGENGEQVAFPGNLVTGHSSASAQFIQNSEGGWSASQSDVTFTWRRNNEEIAKRVVRVFRSSANLTSATLSTSGEPTSHVVSGSGSSALTITATHSNSGVPIYHTIYAIQSGQGVPGEPGIGLWSPVLVNVTQSGATFTKSGGSEGVWDASIRSGESFASCHCSFRLSQTDKAIIAGLSISPATDGTPDSIDYGFYAHHDGVVHFIENGLIIATAATADTVSDWTITYDGFHVRYWKDSTILRTVPFAGWKFYFFAIFANVGASLNQVLFQKGDVGKIDLNTKVEGILNAAYADAGLRNVNIQIAPDGTLVNAGSGQVNLPQLPGSVATGQLTANVVAAIQAVVANLSAIRAELGFVEISTDGWLRSGSTAWDTGNGFFLGRTGGEPGLSLRAGDQFLRYRPSSGLEFRGDFRWIQEITNTFTPTWTGFSVPPSGTLSWLDLGTHAMIWVGGSNNLTGVSNSTAMSFSGVPAEIRPAANRNIGVCLVHDNDIGAQLAWASMLTTGEMIFSRVTAATNVQATGGAWTASGVKGLHLGSIWLYPKG